MLTTTWTGEGRLERGSILGGARFCDLLLRACDRDLVKMEVDIYWLVKGGRDPLATARASYDYLRSLEL